MINRWAENPPNDRTVVLGTLIVILILATTIGPSAVAAQSSELGLSVDAPSEATVDEEVSLSGTVSVPDIVGSHQSEGTVTLLVDGTEVDTQTVTLEDGSSTTVSFTHSFDEAGTHSVTLEASISIGGQSFSNSASTSVDVTAPSTPTATPDIETPEPPSTSTPTLDSPDSPPGTTISGVAFTVPSSLQDEVDEYRSQLPSDVAPNAFILATRDELYVVFTHQTPVKGRATVEGVTVDRQLRVTQDGTTLTFGGIASTSVSFETEGTETSVSAVASNPEQYRLELVRISATHRQVTSLTDPDEGNDFTASTMAGVLTADPLTASSMFGKVGAHARIISRNASQSESNTILGSSSLSSDERLYTFSFETDFWTDAEATVDGIVLNPQSAAARFARTVDQSHLVSSRTGSPLLYVVDKQYDPRSMTDVDEITRRADSLDGEVVSVTARMYGTDLSIQESLEHATTSQCSENRLLIQTPQGPACVNVVQDVLVHSGVAWSTVPSDRSDVLLVLGASSREQDEPTTERRGRFRIVGEVVSTSRINESLPEGSALLVYDIERTGDIDYRAVASEARSLIEDRAGRLQQWANAQAGNASAVTASAGGPPAQVRQRLSDVSAGQPTSVTFPEQAQQQVGIRDLSVTASRSLRDVQVSAEVVQSLPSSVQQPPGRALRTLNISVDASDDDISNGSFTVDVPASGIPNTANVTVYRFHRGNWSQVEANVTSRSEAAITIRVATPGFSYFAVTTDAERSAETKTATQSESATQTVQPSGGETAGSGTSSGSGPGFSALSGLLVLALVTVYYVARREQSE